MQTRFSHFPQNSLNSFGSRFRFAAVASLALALAGCGGNQSTENAAGNAASNTATNSAAAPSGEAQKLLNVSYDPTREFYKEYNEAFTKHWKSQGGGDLKIDQSHGGSGKQARAVVDGLEADVVTFALAYDVDAVAKAKLIDQNWLKKLPNNSAPYTSTIVFLVRKGNPKGIKDWNDLVKPNIQVITPSPKTSGGARWNYLAAWGYAQRQPGGNDAKAKEFVRSIYKNVPVLDSGARGSTTTFTERGIGDVLLTWENEAYLAINKLGKGEFEIVTPSQSILAEASVAVVDKNVKKHGTEKLATEYLKYLYSPEGQKIAARNYYRPRDVEAAKEFKFTPVKLFTIDQQFGGWVKAQKTHFEDGGTFDQIYKPTG